MFTATIATYRRPAQSVKKVTIDLAGTPTTFTATPTILRYDKEFAFSFRFDDGLLDAYTTAFPLFNGGDVVYETGFINDAPGFAFTDGCGNDVKFKCELAINSGAVQDVPNPTSRMNWTMISEIYVAGWGLWNHGANEVVSPAFDGLTQTQIDTLVETEVQQGITDIRDNTGIKCFNFTAPSNDNNYDPYTTAQANSGGLKVVNNIYSPQTDAYLRTYQDWFDSANRIPGIGADYDFNNVVEAANLTRTQADLDFIVNSLAALGPGENRFFANGCHRCNYGDGGGAASVDLEFNDMLDFFTRMENTYGKNGNDSVWFAPQNEIYEFVLTSELAIVNEVINGSQVELTFNFSNVPAEFREHAMTLIINSDQDILSINYENFDTSSDFIGHVGGDPKTALVNVSTIPPFEAAVRQRAQSDVLVTFAENSQQQADVDAAQLIVDGLPNGSYKTSLQARIDAIVVIPDSTIVNVDFGNNQAGSETTGNWNNMTQTEGFTTAGTPLTNMISSTGSITNIGVRVSQDFSAVQTNSRAATSNVNNPFPYTALRDTWETTPTSTGAVAFTNLDPTKVYDFVFCASRGFTDQDTLYTAIGTNTDQVSLTTKNNGAGDVWETASITSGIVPDGSNEIEVTVVGSVGLVPNSSHQGFLGVIQIIERNP